MSKREYNTASGSSKVLVDNWVEENALLDSTGVTRNFDATGRKEDTLKRTMAHFQGDSSKDWISTTHSSLKSLQKSQSTQNVLPRKADLLQAQMEEIAKKQLLDEMIQSAKLSKERDLKVQYGDRPPSNRKRIFRPKGDTFKHDLEDLAITIYSHQPLDAKQSNTSGITHAPPSVQSLQFAGQRTQNNAHKHAIFHKSTNFSKPLDEVHHCQYR